MKELNWNSPADMKLYSKWAFAKWTNVFKPCYPLCLSTTYKEGRVKACNSELSLICV